MPLYKDKISKDQRKVAYAARDMEIPEDAFNPKEDRDQAPVSEDQKEKLASWGLPELPRSARSAQTLINFVEAGHGFVKKDQPLDEIRKKEIIRYMTIYPRGTVVEATYYSPTFIDGVHRKRWATGFGKVIDWYARSFEEKMETHQAIQEKYDKPRTTPLAPFQLIVLFPGGNVERVSMSNIQKYVDHDDPKKSPEGTRKLR